MIDLNSGQSGAQVGLRWIFLKLLCRSMSSACRLLHSHPYGLVNSLLAPHNALTLLCPHIVDELTLATLALPCHTNEVSTAENWVAEGVMNGPLSLLCLLSPADSWFALMFRKSWYVSLWGPEVFGNSRAP